MRLLSLSLADFRCYRSAEFEPAAALTAVVGDNGHGKTSLLEAVSWLATTRSFRGVPDAALVRSGADAAIIRGRIERRGRERLIEAAVARQGRNRVQVNRQAVARAKALGETLIVTVFAPDDLELVKGGPSLRRGYLDDLLAAASPRLAGARSEYERVVRQRNALLRGHVRSAEDRSTLDVWNQQLAAKGADLVHGRLRLLDRVAGPMAKAYADLTGTSAGGTVEGSYEAEWAPEGLPDELTAIERRLTRAVEELGRREIERGRTLVGPHRDEWRLQIDGLDARSHASQGEQRSLALALRLAGHAVITEIVGEPPVLLLDDVFSELDPHRSEALVHHLPPGQAVITTATDLPPELVVDRTVTVHDGVVDAAATRP